MVVLVLGVFFYKTSICIMYFILTIYKYYRLYRLTLNDVKATIY